MAPQQAGPLKGLGVLKEPLQGDEQALPGDAATVILSKTGLDIRVLPILPPVIHSEDSKVKLSCLWSRGRTDS